MSEPFREPHHALSGYTPGPWTAIGPSVGGRPEWRIVAATKGEVCRLLAVARGSHRGEARSYQQHPQDAPNAALIARAPEIPNLERQLADLAALREADQATIATLSQINRELADALEPYAAWHAEIVTCLEKSSDPGVDRLLGVLRGCGSAASIALRKAGRIP